ncbi:MAG: DUF2628 domain-containing protein, partial [Oscillospiraceae bacterium]|nr:DUF2628 domain-containing protein [Oscillospiraceae bacterium]
CPWCGEKFAEGDDIVVCPECGTPHHRACYKEHSACANEEMHGENFEWNGTSSAHTAHKHENTEEGKTVKCAHCGTENPEHFRYCLSCGAPISQEKPKSRYEASYEEFQRERERIFSESFSSDFDGVSPKEAAVFVRSNVGYFLPRFAAFSKGAKFDTNFSAFIFSYMYLFYRKMYGFGLAVFAVINLLSIPTYLLDFQLIQEEYVKAGLLSQVIWNVPHQEELAVYSIIGSVFIWMIRIALCMFFNRIYYSKVVSDIKKNRESLATESQEKIAAFFRKKGGTTLLAPILLAAAIFLVYFVLAGFVVTSEFFILPEIQNFL